MKKYKAILFDFDCVLGNTMDDNYKAWSHALAAYGIGFSKEDYFLLEGLNTHNLASHFLGDRDESEIEKVRALKEEHYLTHAKFCLYDGVEQLISRVKKQHSQIALVTGASRQRLVKSNSHSFLSLFDAIITADDTANGKPNSDPYLAAAANLKISASDCLVVE